MKKNIISKTTKDNWERIGFDDNKLKSRANKRLSNKFIYPIEYLNNKNNLNIILNFINKYKDNNILDILYSLSVQLLKNKNIFNKRHVQSVLKEYNYNIIEIENIFDIEERDILGFIYQILINEGNKNIKGSYYTPQFIVKDIIKDINFKNKTILDPCCGSGSFFLELNNIKPENIYGFDNDPIAVFICKINLLLKYYDSEFVPNIKHLDFLSSNINNKFDYIISNPPWGSYLNKDYNIIEINSKESFSYFFVKSFNLLKKNGIINFLFPVSILNVKLHQDIRNFMLSNGLIEIVKYDKVFNNVFTDCVSIKCVNKKIKENVKIFDYKTNNIKELYLGNNNSFLIKDNDLKNKIYEKIKNKGKYYLKKDNFALGIVTGNNKEKIKKNKENGNYVGILTGKDINKYILNKINNYIIYNPLEFQQIAKEEYYFAKEKLLYKFISNNLVFAYDNKQTLVLNSANILIPEIKNMDIKVVMAFLNSDVFKFYYLMENNSIKVLKNFLMNLSFPEITLEQNNKIKNLVDLILKTEDLRYHIEIQKIIYNIYELNEEEIKEVIKI